MSELQQLKLPCRGFERIFLVFKRPVIGLLNV